MKPANRVTPAVMVFLTIFLCPWSYAEDIVIGIGNGSGKAGAQNSPITVMLDNAGDVVKGVQVYICDDDNYLSAKSCAATGRASNFSCMINECQSNASSISSCRSYPGCANVVMYSPGEVIAAGRGPIAIIGYNVAENAPSGCITLNPKKAAVSDQNRNRLTVMADGGQFCVNGGSSDDTTTTARSSNTTPENPDAESPTDSTDTTASAGGNSSAAASAQSGLRTPLGGSSGSGQETSTDTDADTFGSPETASRKRTTGSRSGVSSGAADTRSTGSTGAKSASGSEVSRLIISPSLSVINSKGMLALDAHTIADGREIQGKYTWQIQPPSTIGSTIDADGIFTAGTNTSASPVQETIHVTDTSNKSISSTATITIEGLKEPPEGCALLVTPSSAEIVPGNVITFTATKFGKTCGEGSYQWKVSSKIGSTITEDGVYTAGVNRGTAAALDIILVKDREEDLSIDALVTVAPGDEFSPAGSSSAGADDGRAKKARSPLLPGALIAVAAFVAVAGVLMVRKRK